MPEQDSLLVAVELDTTRLSNGLQKLEREAKRSAAKMSKSFAAAAEQSIQAEALTGKLRALAAAAEEVTAAFSAWEEIGEIVKGVHESVSTWLVDKFSVVIAGVEDATGRIVALWRELRDELVENSIVPEMVGDIGNWFDRLPDLVGAPTEAATAKAAEGFERLGTRVGRAISEMTRSGEVKFRNFRDVLAEIAASITKVLLQAFVNEPPSGLLRTSFGGGEAKGRDTKTGRTAGRDFAGIIERAEETVDVTRTMTQAFEEMGAGVGRALSAMIADGVAKLSTFKEFLARTIEAIRQTIIKQLLTQAIFRVLGSLLGGGAALGAPAQQLTAAIRPLAHGGPAAAGVPLLVGERGPEIFVPSLAGTVLSNRQSRAALGGGGPTFFVDARGADVAAVQRLESFVAGLHGSLETRAVEAVANASARGRRFGFAT